jgi:type II secretory pathway pseudopilin PulG
MAFPRRQTAITLLEILIVVALIGVIAAVAVPRISRGARGAADSDVLTSLVTLRSAIDLYYREHNFTYPAQDNSPETFIDQLTKRTDAQGNVGANPDIYIYGPYLYGDIPAISVGPNRGANGVFVAGTGPTVDESLTTIGWVYNSTTGDLIANTDDRDETGLGYELY